MPKMPEMPQYELPLENKGELVKVLAEMVGNVPEDESNDDNGRSKEGTD